MSTLWEIALNNTCIATALAVIALLVSRFAHRPALAHGLWVLVLLKLLTPPMIELSLVEAPPWLIAPDPGTPGEEPAPVETSPANATWVGVLSTHQANAAPAVNEHRNGAGPGPVLLSIMGAWSIGALFILGLSFWRVLGFRKLVKHARAPSRDVSQRYKAVARRMGLENGPPIEVVHAPISPMLWGARRARVLLPSHLVQQLDTEGLETLLAHELAHYCRRDHWVRFLELFATALLWWHPLTWLARRELREVEEQSCDAWVLSTLPQRSKVYATALLDTVDFLTEGHALPPAASGASGTAHLLKRRVTMIMEGRAQSRMSVSGRLSVAALAMAILPVLPISGQEGSTETKTEAKKNVKVMTDTTRYVTTMGVPVEVEKATLGTDTFVISDDALRSTDIDFLAGGDDDDLRAAVRSLKAANKNLTRAIERLEKSIGGKKAGKLRWVERETKKMKKGTVIVQPGPKGSWQSVHDKDGSQIMILRTDEKGNVHRTITIPEKVKGKQGFWYSTDGKFHLFDAKKNEPKMLYYKDGAILVKPPKAKGEKKSKTIKKNTAHFFGTEKGEWRTDKSGNFKLNVILRERNCFS